jgi:hypothetical protein
MWNVHRYVFHFLWSRFNRCTKGGLLYRVDWFCRGQFPSLLLPLAEDSSPSDTGYRSCKHPFAGLFEDMIYAAGAT